MNKGVLRHSLTHDLRLVSIGQFMAVGRHKLGARLFVQLVGEVLESVRHEGKTIENDRDFPVTPLPYTSPPDEQGRRLTLDLEGAERPDAQ
ncbi:MAG: hypothetical protein H6741_14720 [Alphaproteobacteria bacterium]|nr:hypothetical protein [Alphaproteobacteria bacterium]MCB9793971.1 hypothetical protein [Alphaproteobacteria bacterium]